MTTSDKLKILQVIKILALVIFCPILFFYLVIVVPEYLACINCNSEGAMGKDIWGNEVQCFGDSKEFGEYLFQLFSIIILFLIAVITALFLLIRHLKTRLK